MGRGKIEIKRIENSTNRQVTFSKRRNGIIKKAREISILCEAQVSVVIFSSSGKMSEYRSPSTSLSEILERYQQNSGEKLWDAKHESLSAEIDRIKKENDNMQIELRHLKGEDLNSLYPKELIPIEEALQIGLTSVREKQMEIWKMHKNNVKMLDIYFPLICAIYWLLFLPQMIYISLHVQEKLLEDENKQLTYMLVNLLSDDLYISNNFHSLLML
ncbi:GLO-like MADS-BOX transcription factor [Canna indica]|uniref:GLO-like MADS-BOX transcription factor n=1 Tax=Canna indica TaxID=4628 RepID=A0AAQ3JUP2_9LILI|nr:GLO-like MADS-BOX transcription factor [Canna indica]